MYPRGSEIREALKTWHYMLGLTVFFLVWVRIAARLFGKTPPIVPASPKWQLIIANSVELALATIGYFLIGLHALAALFHHYVRRDNTLRRMRLSH